MNGLTEKTFRWILNDTSSDVQYKAYSRTVSTNISSEERFKQLEIQSLRKDAKSKSTALKTKRLQSIDARKPPELKLLVP
jgi:hypothetical protein